jgi:hypothetical protein
MEYTKGEWIASIAEVQDLSGRWRVRIENRYKRLIALTFGNTKEEAEDNAKLICNSGAMLEDLQKAYLKTRHLCHFVQKDGVEVIEELESILLLAIKRIEKK